MPLPKRSQDQIDELAATFGPAVLVSYLGEWCRRKAATCDNPLTRDQWAWKADLLAVLVSDLLRGPPPIRNAPPK